MGHIGIAVIKAALVVAVTAWSAPTLAQTQQQRDWCYKDGATDDQTIEGCSAVLESPQTSTKSRAIAYYNRGLAYANKKDQDRAISNFDKAIETNPEDPDFFIDRGIAY